MNKEKTHARGFFIINEKNLIVIVSCLILIGVLYYINSDQKRGQEDLQALFNRWDRGEVEDSEKTKIMNTLADRLRENPQFSIKEIEEISKFFSFFEADSLKVIQYIENPEFYGSSGRESFHIVVYNDLVEIIDSRGSMRIEDIKRRDEHLYYVYATDYRITNITGIHVFKIEIEDGQTLDWSSLINKERLTDNFQYDEASEVLYYHDGHIYYKEIRDNGNEVLITAADTDYLLQLGDDGLYYIAPE
jgi:hypothetical protein